MSSGSHDLAAYFTSDCLSEDEVFSRPIEDAYRVGGSDSDDSARVSPLRVALEREERRSSVLRDFMRNDAFTPQGVGVHAEAAPESALEPLCMGRHVEICPNSEEQLAALISGAPDAPDAPALPGHNMSAFRRSANHSPPVKRRRAPGRRIPHAASAPPALRARVRRQRRRMDVPNAGGSIFVRGPLGLETADPNTTIILEDFPSMLQHPFDASITPVLCSLRTAFEAQASSIRASYQTFSAPAIDSTTVTAARSPFNPVQDPLQSNVAQAQYRSPPVSLEEMENQPMNLEQLSSDERARIDDIYRSYASETSQQPFEMAFGPLLNGDLARHYYEWINDPNSPAIADYDPYEQAKHALVGDNGGPALGSNPDGQMINTSSLSASFGHSFDDMDLRAIVNGFISPPAAKESPKPAAPQAELNDARITRTRRLTWTPELISKFEAAIVILGGPTKATPKAIARCMACPQVNILNVKSRLQKFRLQTGMGAGTSRGTRRSHASTVTIRDIEPPRDDSINMGTMLNLVYKTCKNWSQQLDMQNLYMRHMLAEHHMRTEVATHNARVMEEHAERVSAELEAHNPDEVMATEP